MPRHDPRRLSPAVRAVLRAGRAHPRGLCSLPWRLSGAARAALLRRLFELGLVEIRNWSTEGEACRAGSVIGKLTKQGQEALWRKPR